MNVNSHDAICPHLHDSNWFCRTKYIDYAWTARDIVHLTCWGDVACQKTQDYKIKLTFPECISGLRLFKKLISGLNGHNQNVQN